MQCYHHQSRDACPPAPPGCPCSLAIFCQQILFALFSAPPLHILYTTIFLGPHFSSSSAPPFLMITLPCSAPFSPPSFYPRARGLEHLINTSRWSLLTQETRCHSVKAANFKTREDKKKKLKKEKKKQIAARLML